MTSNKFPFLIEANRGGVNEWRRLLDEAFIRGTEEPIISKRGKRSKWIFDMRIPLTDGSQSAWLGEHLAWALTGGKFNAKAIASYGVAGTLTVGAVLPHMPNLKACIVLPDRKSYGRCRIVEGARPESVVFIDDILSGGNTSLNAIKVLKAEGIRVEGVLTIVRYGWGRGARRLHERGIKAAHLVCLNKQPHPQSSS